MLIEGIFAAIPTPFYADEKIFYRKLEANVARSSRTLLAGLLVLGAAGEAAAVDDAEARELLRVAADAAAPEKVLVAGVARVGVKAAVELAEAAASFRYDAVLVDAPSSGQLSPATVLHFFRTVADRSPLPVLVNAAQALTIAQIAELAQHPNLIGLLESGGSERVQAVLAATQSAPRRTVTVTPIFEAVTTRMLAPKPETNAEAGGNFVTVGDLATGAFASSGAAPVAALKTRTKEVGFQVLTSSPTNLLAALQLGASGGIFDFAAFAPEAVQEIYLAWKDHDLKLAAENQQRIAAASQRIAELGVSGLKYASDFNGYYGGRARAPQPLVNAAEKLEIEGLLAAIRN